MNKVLNFLRAALRNPKTTAAGVTGVVVGIQMIVAGDLQHGIAFVVTGAGLVASVDDKEEPKAE
jgi:hypothetical protein